MRPVVVAHSKPFGLYPLMTLLVLVMSLTIGSSVSYADPPEGRGNGQANGQGDGPPEDRGNGNGQAGGQERQESRGNPDAPGRSRAEEAKASAASRAEEARTEAASRRAEEAVTNVDRSHPHQDRRAQAAVDRTQAVGTGQDTGTRLARATPSSAAERSGDRGLRGHEAAQAHVAELLDALTQLERVRGRENARWAYNPHDTRGQGNMGTPTMRDPYGFDKDSGREGADRGRPIRERESTEPPAEPAPEPVQEPADAAASTPSLNLADITTLDVTDPYVTYLQETIARINTLIATYPDSASYSSWLWLRSYYQQLLTNHVSSDTYQAVLWHQDLIDYSLTFQPFEGMEGTTFLVTTQLISTETTTLSGYTGDWESFTTTYETGQVLVEQTQELTLTQEGTYTFTLDPSTALLGGGFFNGSSGVTADIVVTVTDPVSGATYTMTFDKQVALVDPYGIVYDRITGQPIAGATVTVHNVDGSVVALDQSGNPNVHNPQTTDATGRYNYKLPVGRQYYLTVAAPGYAPYQSSVFSERGTIVREDVGLSPLSDTTPHAAAPPLQATAPLTAEAQQGTTLPGLGMSSPLPAK
jgi:hypothetical protein